MLRSSTLCLVLIVGLVSCQTAPPGEPATGPIVPTLYNVQFSWVKEFYRRFTGDEATALSNLNFRWGDGRNATKGPANDRSCPAPYPLPASNPGSANEELFSFDLFNYTRSGPKRGGYSIYLDINDVSADSGLFLGVVDSAGTFWGFRRSTGPSGVPSSVLGDCVKGVTNQGTLDIGAGGHGVFTLSKPQCVCGTSSSNCQASECVTGEPSFGVYISIPDVTDNTTAAFVGAYSRLYTFATNKFTINGGSIPSFAEGMIRVAAYAVNPSVQHNLFAISAVVKDEAVGVKSRIFGGIFTGNQLLDWWTRNSSHFTLPSNSFQPFMSPYSRNTSLRDPSFPGCSAPYLSELFINGTNTTVNQFLVGVQDQPSLQEEFEMTWYFPVVPANVLNTDQDVVVRVHSTIQSGQPVNQDTDGGHDARVAVGVYDGEFVGGASFNFLGFEKLPVNYPAGATMWARPFYEPGFLYLDIQNGNRQEITQTVKDKFNRNSFYIRRGSFSDLTGPDFYDEGPSDLFVRHGVNIDGIPDKFAIDAFGSLDFGALIIQGPTTTVPSSDLYSWVVGGILDPQDVGRAGFSLEGNSTPFLSPPYANTLLSAFTSGGTVTYQNSITNRRLNPLRVWGFTAFTFMGRANYGSNYDTNSAPPLQAVPDTGLAIGWSGVAILVDNYRIGCTRDGRKIFYDLCLVCRGNNSCVDCSGTPNGTKTLDICGQCDGHNASCIGCDGIAGSGKKLDVCGICAGNGTTCLDCSGTPNGTKVFDSCKVCGGPGPDKCGDCGGNGTRCLDCQGTPFGTFVRDKCNVCGGNNSCLDCAGVPNGTNILDACGKCAGFNRSCCINYLGISNQVWDWLLLKTSIDDIILRLTGLADLIRCARDNLPAYDSSDCSGNRHGGRITLEKLMVRDMVDQLTNWYMDCLTLFTDILVPRWVTELLV